MNSQEVRDKHKKHLFEAVKNFYQEPVVITEAKGTRVSDMDGNSYLDFFGGILTVSVGHANEEVNDAVIAQVNHFDTYIFFVPHGAGGGVGRAVG